jgi:hypothetical protein
MTVSQRTGAFWRVAVFGLVLASASCGGGNASPDGGGGTGAGGGGAPATGTPVQMCNQLVHSICTRDVSCNAADGSAGALADCELLENVLFGCDRATSTNFGDCLNDTKTVSCAGLFTPNGLFTPASCDDPLNIPLSDAQMKCVALVRTLCTRALQCDGQVNPAPVDVQDCEASIFFDPAGIPCPYATGVSATYDQCVTELAAAPCPAPDGGTADGGGGGPIASCQAVIMTP